MSQVDDIVRKYGDVMVEKAADHIAQESRARILRSTVLADGDVLGAPEVASEPLTPYRVRLRRKIGAISATIPLLRFGGLFKSIHSMITGDGEAAAVVDAPYAAMHQYGRAQAFMDEAGRPGFGPKARPFFGLSEQGLETIDRMVQNQGQQMIAELDGLTLDPVTIEMTV